MFPDKAPCKYTDYLTPPRILQPVRAYFGGRIPCDPASTDENPTAADRFITPDDAPDGLAASWGAAAFVNPPYGRALRQWVAKINEEAGVDECEILALLPGQRFEQRYIQEGIFSPALTAFCMVRRRVSFLRPDGTEARGNPYGSFVFCFNGRWQRFQREFAPLGSCVLVGGLA